MSHKQKSRRIHDKDTIKGPSQELYNLMHPNDHVSLAEDVARIVAAKYPDPTTRREACTGTRQLSYCLRQKEGSYILVGDDAKFFNVVGVALCRTRWHGRLRNFLDRLSLVGLESKVGWRTAVEVSRGRRQQRTSVWWMDRV